MGFKNIPSTAAASNTEYAEDVAHSSGDTGTFILAVRNDAGTALAADGDYIAFTVDSTGALRVAGTFSADVPTNPTKDVLTVAAVAAGATSDLDSVELGGAAWKVDGILVGSSVATKWELVQVDNSVEGTVHSRGFTSPGDVRMITFPHRDFISVTFIANAGFDGYRVKVTNMDTSEAADVYATIFRSQ